MAFVKTTVAFALWFRLPGGVLLCSGGESVFVNAYVPVNHDILLVFRSIKLSVWEGNIRMRGGEWNNGVFASRETGREREMVAHTSDNGPLLPPTTFNNSPTPLIFV
jgi:hypothetical protein